MGILSAGPHLDVGSLQGVQQVVQHRLLHRFGKEVELIQHKHHRLVAPAMQITSREPKILNTTHPQIQLWTIAALSCNRRC